MLHSICLLICMTCSTNTFNAKCTNKQRNGENCIHGKTDIDVVLVRSYLFVTFRQIWTNHWKNNKCIANLWHKSVVLLRQSVQKRGQFDDFSKKSASAKTLPQPSASFRNTWQNHYIFAASAKASAKLPQASATHEILHACWNNIKILILTSK